MARTKKELKDQAPVEEQVVGEGIGLSGEALQPDSGEQDEIGRAHV